jgi:phage terminase large subunit-like protein
LHGLVFDELMTQKTRDMWNALTSAQGAREQPLVFAISTAGWDQLSVCFEQHELVREIHEGNAVDDVFLGAVFGAPMDGDWTAEEVWRRANPSLGETVTIDSYREHARRAAGLTAFTVLVEGTDVYLWAFLPEEGILERERRDRVPYRVWAEQGSLTLTPGPVIDYAYVKRAVREAAAAFDLRSVEFDRWNSSQVVRELEDEGIAMLELGQGFSSLSAPTKELQRLVVEEKLRHGGIRYCAGARQIRR